MYRRIVVPLDGSDLAERALRDAEQIARLSGARLHLIRVIDVTQLPWYGRYAATMDRTTFEGAIVDECAQCGAYLDGLAKRYAGSGIEVTHETRSGRAVPELVAATEPGDLFVMTSHGHGGVRRWFLGSVADDLLRHATVPVLLITAQSATRSTADAAEDLRVTGDRAPVLAGQGEHFPEIPVDGW